MDDEGVQQKAGVRQKCFQHTRYGTAQAINWRFYNDFDYRNVGFYGQWSLVGKADPIHHGLSLLIPLDNILSYLGYDIDV